MEFENIHCHTCLSNAYIGMPDSPVFIKNYADAYKERGMKCLVMSEHGYRGDCWQQYDIAKNYDMKAIDAAEIYFVPDRKTDDGRNFHLLLIAKNMTGFEELNLLLSESQTTGFYKHGRADFELLSQLNPDHFICTTACIGGVLKDEKGEYYVNQLAEIFKKNFYLEVQHHNNEKQKIHNEKVINLYNKYHYPLIFGADTHYVYPSEKILRKELQLSSKIDIDDSEWDLHLPTVEEAYNCFIQQNVLTKARIEEAFYNTLQVREFEGFYYDSERKFPITRQSLSYEERAKEYQKIICNNYIKMFGNPTKEEAQELRKEMNIVLETKSVDYFLSLHDIIEQGIKDGGIITKTSRGSAASFATSAALGFTSLNRLHESVKLFPERFVSKEKLKNSMADVDTNCANPEIFEEAGRKLLGENGCFPMIAITKQKELSAFKMLSRARNIEPKISDAISKQIQIYEIDRKHKLENNEDDPDYNVDEDISIEDYIEEQYIDIIKDSKQYLDIVSTMGPHPCARLCYQEDIRKKIGLISLKPKKGKKERTICACIEGATADNAGYCKLDLLKVDVVSVINDTFKMINQNTPDIDQLKEWIDKNPEVWDLYEKGFCQGLNQCEKEGTKNKVTLLKPKNVVELAAFVAAIRPGAKSLVNDFINRNKHVYNIPAMDDLLKLNGATGVTAESSFLFYDEQVAILAKAAGIDPGDAVLLQKAIKKKKYDKVKKYESSFIPGFTKYLQEKQNTELKLAEKTSHDVWTVIINGAQYLFNASHALSMAYDSLYGAMLKTIAPYEFYCVLLKLYTEKKQLDKIFITIDEMKKYKNINFSVGKFGQDNRDWLLDKENECISQNLSAIKYITKHTANELYEAGLHEHDSFVMLLLYLLKNTNVNKKEIEILIKINYFSSFGKTKKLLTLFEEFNEGKYKITKTTSRSLNERLNKLNELEQTIEDEDISMEERLCTESENIGLCFSKDLSMTGKYFVSEVDSKYGIKIKLYNICTGRFSPTIRMRKDLFDLCPLVENKCINLTRKDYEKRKKYYYKNGKRTEINNAFEFWITNYEYCV